MNRTFWTLLLIIAVTHSLPGQVAIAPNGPKLVEILEQNADLGLKRFPIGVQVVDHETEGENNI